MADVKDIYDLILSGQPGGGYSGIYKPSAPVMLPPQGMGSNQALARLLSDPTGPGPDRGALSGMIDDPIYSGAAPYSGQSIIPHASGTQIASKDNSRLSPSPAGNLFAYGSGIQQSPAQRAIASIAGNNDLSWEDANPAAMPAGQTDPWGTLRIGSSAPVKGMVTGNTVRNVANTPIGKLMSGLAALNPPRTGGGLAAIAPSAPTPAPGANFLQQQGQSTQGMVAGEVANALKKSMGKLL